ncbi:MAG: hypothetical protein CSB47_05915 [Proteobacteria bacterium]|nr:MAG: hypothetical protein CSB47_05915 [Pseudomonadota bacterium]
MNMKAQEWLERGRRSEDPFDAFSNFWRGFNNLYAGRGVRESEKNLISMFLDKHVSDEDAQYLLDTYTKEIASLTDKPVTDMRGNGRDTSNFIAKFKQSETAVEKLIALFKIIYQVRCNLEHGQKSPSRERDKNLCLHAGPIIAEIVEKYA